MYGYFLRDYLIGEIDAINYINVYVVSLLLTYFVYKLNLGYNKPFLIKCILSLVIIFLIVWESSVISISLISIKILYTLISCFMFWQILNKLFNE